MFALGSEKNSACKYLLSVGMQAGTRLMKVQNVTDFKLLITELLISINRHIYNGRFAL